MIWESQLMTMFAPIERREFHCVLNCDIEMRLQLPIDLGLLARETSIFASLIVGDQLLEPHLA